MNKIEGKDREIIYHLVALIEKVIKVQKLDPQFHRDEVEKHFSYILQGKDDINPYERRDAGVTDEEWNKAIQNCRIRLDLEKKKHEKLFNF